MSEDYLTNNVSQTEFSVSEISSRIKQLLENNLGTVKVKGEISGLKIAASGHGYFSLKDNNAVLAATCWRYALARVNFKLTEGLEVVVTGKITAYAGQSKYQISVELIEPYGVGAFMKILSERRQKLEAEGLFAKEHKQPIPFLPQKIGIITSLSGAVIKDIIHRISDRCPTHLVVWPVSVQGETAASEISTAIDGFNKLSESQKPSLLIIARGGGSIEDLWAFNEEIVVRSVFNSKIPTISAVGHETDYTLIDLAADLRAPTPTAAAEFAVPVVTDLKYTLKTLQDRAQYRLFDLLKYYSRIIVSINSSLMQTQSIVNNYTQRIDELSFRLLGALPNLLRQKLSSLQHFPVSRLKPTRIINYKYLQYKNSSENLLNKKTSLLTPLENKLKLNSSLLASLDYNNVLKRGFAMVKTSNDNIISSITELEKSQHLKLKMRDGEIHITKTNT
ncbi:MAG: exodeoxyribonuclease VII large subunit [Rickettsiaceae bacterium]